MIQDTAREKAQGITTIITLVYLESNSIQWQFLSGYEYVYSQNDLEL